MSINNPKEKERERKKKHRISKFSLPNTRASSISNFTSFLPWRVLMIDAVQTEEIERRMWQIGERKKHCTELKEKPKFLVENGTRNHFETNSKAAGFEEFQLSDDDKIQFGGKQTNHGRSTIAAHSYTGRHTNRCVNYEEISSDGPACCAK